VNASSSLSSSGDDDGVAVCYLCLGGGADDNNGQPLRRDCACRGTDAGFVHLACLADYAETKSKAWDGRDTNKFIKPWEKCPGCHQYYQNELGIDIATKFASFVQRQYPDDTRMQVEALYLKLAALNNMLNRLQPEPDHQREAGDTATELLSLIHRMRVVAPLTWLHSWFESYAYSTLGRIANYEGTEESARRAVLLFEKSLQVFEAIGDNEGIATAKKSIAKAKSKYEGDSNIEEFVKTSQELYELRISTYGEESEYTIRAGKDYTIALRQANRGEEAMELLTKLLATSKQVLGPHHNITKQVESKLECVKIESIGNDADQD
jgi:hypothetical protein